jgi:S-formylglutathione hydrolase FrmB/lysophospholipase L1-like esterase
MMLEGLGPSLQKRFTQIEGLVVSREGKYATGLCRLDYFDWFKFFNDLLTAKEPDLVIISIGANDTQDIVDDQRRRHLVTSDGWREIYGQRVQDLLKIAAAKKAEVIWVGLPIMGREPYNGRAAVINQVAKAACQKSPNCRFFDAWDILADDQGRYSTFLPINDKKQRVRAKDSIHLTEAGGRIMAEAFWTYLSDLATFGETKKADPTLLAAQSPESRAIISDPALTPKVNPADVLGAFPPQAANLTSTDLSPTDSNPTNSSQTNLNPPDESLSQGHEPPFFPKADQNDAGADQTAPATAPIPTDPDGPTDLKAEAKISQGPAALKDQKPVLTSAALVEASLNSKALSREVKYQVFAPKGPGPFPAVFLLPGVGENYTAFATHFGQALFQKAESLGLALVTIDSGPDGWYLDSPIKAHSNYATHFFQELLPDVLAKFPLIPDQLALLGISMGGHGALRFALVAPSRFKAVSSLSAVLDLTSHGGDQAINRFLNLKPLLGPYPERADLWRAASVYQTTRKRPEALSGTGLFLTVGLSDRLTLAENRQYNRLLTELGVPHRYREDSGGHDWKLWAKELDDHLDFLAQRLRAPR